MKQDEYPPHVARAIEEAEKADAERRVDNYFATKGRATHKVLPSPNQSAPSFVAKGRTAKPRGMNKLESEYSGHLFSRRSTGEVLWYEYEALTLRIGFDCRYTPDFAVQLKSGEMELHEVKGAHRWEDSIVKLRAAAALYPFRFVLVTRDGDGWKHEEIKP